MWKIDEDFYVPAGRVTTYIWNNKTGKNKDRIMILG